MEHAPLHIAVIIGSNREGRFGDKPGQWIADQISKRPEFTVDIIDLAFTALPPVFTMQPDEDVNAYRARLDKADAFVVVTAEYNHSFPASLKHAIDFAKREWRRKPVAFVSYGGASGGLRAVEHLRGVFSELHVVGLRDVVSFHNYYAMFDSERKWQVPDSYSEPAALMLDELAWWGNTLRNGRNELTN